MNALGTLIWMEAGYRLYAEKAHRPKSRLHWAAWLHPSWRGNS